MGKAGRGTVFFEEPDVGSVLKRGADHDLEFKPMDTTFFLSRETVIAFFRLPANRMVELGMQVEL